MRTTDKAVHLFVRIIYTISDTVYNYSEVVARSFKTHAEFADVRTGRTYKDEEVHVNNR